LLELWTPAALPGAAPAPEACDSLPPSPYREADWMSVTDELPRDAGRDGASFGEGDQAVPPARRLVVLACTEDGVRGFVHPVEEGTLREVR
jgi:hypothetical protein